MNRLTQKPNNMKIISNVLKILPFLFLTVMFNSCSLNDDGDDVVLRDPTIVDIAASSPSLSLLVEALVAADGNLPAVLSEEGPYTVLAPTNEAFQSFLNDNGFASIQDIPKDVLTQVLLNHVIAADVRSTDLVNEISGYTTTLATGADDENLSLYYSTNSGVMFNGMASVVTGGADIIASNGTIHVVDAVIALPSIADFALSNPALSNLVAALQLADSQDDSPMLVSTLNNNGDLAPFTVFAPTNDAFAALLMELDPEGNTGLGDLDPALVESVLGYHVIAGANVTSDELNSGALTTLGGNITLDAEGLTLTDPNGRVSNIIPTLVDIQATNGVVHAIDLVILPPQ